MRMKKFLALLLCVMMMLSTFGMLTATAANQIKNIIYMIPDGGGMVPFYLADAVKQAGGVNAKFPNSTPQTVDYMYLKDYLVAAETTYSANQAVTDSAAGGTALATGTKTKNNTVGLDASYRPLATILEAAQYVGKRAGLVTTYPWAHATPAAFSSHALDRYDYRTISEQQINQGLDIVLPFNATGATAYDEAAEDIAAHGYSSVTTVDQMLALQSGAKVWGTLGGSHAFTNRDITNAASYPNLAEMTKAAIQALEGSEEGFFLLVEGSAVDGGGHQSNGLDMVTEFIAFDEACKVAIEYAKGRTDTVVVAAPDHDTGGMKVLNQAAAISNIQNGIVPDTSVMTWDGNGSHTARNGGVFLYVPDGVTRLPGTSPTPGLESNYTNYRINNIDIAPWLASLIGVDLEEMTDKLFVDVTGLGTYTPTSTSYHDYEDGDDVTTTEYTGYFTFNDYDLTVERNTSVATYNGQTIDLDGQVCVYSAGHFYVPQLLLDTVGIEVDPDAVILAPSTLTTSTLAGSVKDSSGCSVGNESISMWLANQSTAYLTLEIGVPKTAYYDVQAMLTSSNGNILCNNGWTGTFDNGQVVKFAAGATKGQSTWMSDSSSSVLLEAGNHTVTFRSGDLCSNIYIYGVQIVEDTSITPPTVTATPAPTEAPVATAAPSAAPILENVDYTNAPYAGVYHVTSDADVTLNNETGHKLALAAGESGYIYLIKGNNNLVISDTSANLTITGLENNGMDIIDSAPVGLIPLTSEYCNMGDSVVQGTNIVNYIYAKDSGVTQGSNTVTVPAGQSFVLNTGSSTPSGLYYVGLQISSTSANSIQVKTSAGHYGSFDNLTTTATNGWIQYEDGSSGEDLLMVYLTEGNNYLTVTNTGSSSVTIGGMHCARTSTIYGRDYQRAQVAIAECKVIPYGDEEIPLPTPTATPAPTPTPTPDPNNVVYEVEYAGVYQVSSDKAVTATNETGSTVTLAAGETKYMYMIQGNNNVSQNDTTATLTFTKLDNNGMDYMDQVTIANEPVITGQEDAVYTDLYQTLAVGETYTFTYNAGKAGLVYPYILFNKNTADSVIRVSTDTGFYADLVPGGSTGTTWCWADANQTDVEILYVRQGANTITIENIGSDAISIENINIHSAGELTGHATWGSQINVANLKVIGEEAEPTPTPEPTEAPTPTPVPDDVITYTAPLAGIYAVTADADVTLTSELGSVAAIAAGETKYLYLIKGENAITTTNKAANVTISALAGQGMAFADQLVMGTEPVISGQEDIVLEDLGYSLAPGATYTFTYTPSQGKAGLVYPYIYMSGAGETTLKVTSDTGFYAELFRPDWSGYSICWADANQTDFELLYVRNGVNTITIENTGDQTVMLQDIRVHSAGELSSHATWGSQINVANLKPILSESEYTGFALDEAAATATVSFTQMGTMDDEVVSLIIAEYDAATGKLLQVNIESIDTSKQEMGTTVDYSVSLTGVTGNLKAMLMNDNLVPYFNVAE